MTQIWFISDTKHEQKVTIHTRSFLHCPGGLIPQQQPWLPTWPSPFPNSSQGVECCFYRDFVKYDTSRTNQAWLPPWAQNPHLSNSRSVIVVISLFLHCIFKSYSSIRLSSHKCVINSVFSVENALDTHASQTPINDGENRNNADAVGQWWHKWFILDTKSKKSLH